MKSSYVLTKYVTCSTTRTTLLDLDSEDITRILSFSWIPHAPYSAVRLVYGLVLEQGSSNDDVYQIRYAAPSVGPDYNDSAFVFAEIPSHGILFKGDVKLASSPYGYGVGAAFFTYQTG